MSKAKATQQEPQTIEITNFGGRLTRILNGDLNSGFAKFNTSWGYDPFSKPMNLTWFEAPVDLDPSDTTINMTMMAAKSRIEGGNVATIYAVGANGSDFTNAAKLFKITPNSVGNPNLDTVSVLASLTNKNFQFGAAMEFYGTNSSLISISTDTNLITINTDGSGETVKTGLVNSRYHPLSQFIGKLYIGNGNNLASQDSSGIVVSSVLSPALPSELYIRDINVTPDGDYISIGASQIPSERLDYGYDRISAATGTGYVFNWNGIDLGITNYRSFPSHAITAFKTYMGNQYLFSNDSFGLSLDNGSRKVLTLPNNRSAIPNAIASDGNFVTWLDTEFADSTLYGSMYYFGNLDDENKSGLWRMFRQKSSQANGFIYTVPFNILGANKFSTLNSAETAVATYGFGKHYFSTLDIANGGGTLKYKLYRFCVTPTGTGTPTLGVYETQTQLFTERIQIKQARVYCEPTVTGNGFQIDFIDSDGTVISNSATNTYTFAAGTDPTLLQGAQQRINFNPVTQPIYAVGVRITNTGTTNMTIKKVELDWYWAGK